MTTTTPTNLAPASVAVTHDVDTGEPGALRVAGAAGIAFVVLSVASTFAAGAPPASDASSGTVAKFFHDHSGGIKAQQFVGGLSIVALFWFFGGLWRALSRAEGERPRLAITATVGLAVGAALAMVSGLSLAVAAFRVDGGPATTHLLFTLSFVAISAAGAGIGTFLLATNIVVYRTRLAARWIAYVGGLAGLAFLGGTLGMLTDANVINVLNLVAFFAWCVWIVAVSVGMMRDGLTPARPRA